MAVLSACSMEQGKTDNIITEISSDAESLEYWTDNTMKGKS